MEIQNGITISLTREEAIQLTKVLPRYGEANTEDEVFAAQLRGELCEKLFIKPWDL